MMKNNQNDKLILDFVDDYYDMFRFKEHNIYNTEITIQSSIIFKGNSNGTIFDYKNNYYGNIHMSCEKKELLVKFENIIFKNFDPSSQHRVGIVTFMSAIDDFQLQFYNCTFINIIVNNLVLHLNPVIIYPVEKPQILYDKCNFFNNTDIGISIVHENKYSQYISDIYKYFTIKYTNCDFIDNNVYYEYHNNGYIFENCYFSNPKIDISYPLFIPYPHSSGVIIKFINSIFDNIYMKKPNPYILADGLDLE
ncbi:hypothetical protein PIROE2DRAFT_9525 [Piromyces sp. E2]|nr:hypothetical protein PIROE2DRAFT_9525 [Piromyces sp. E2]|eukprot:OUM63856.1 hypothetical protein PIROE2DRAFT_9525 [Piromyces sp. E2]